MVPLGNTKVPWFRPSCDKVRTIIGDIMVGRNYIVLVSGYNLGEWK